jgi:signal transduction histidine kinase
VLSALGNLVQNAIKYSKKGGSIHITAVEKNKMIEIDVSDECGGISNEKIAEMFKPFQQLNEDRSGLGLGLNIARKAIAHCGGNLTVKSIGSGCTFKMQLPLYLEAIVKTSLV